MALHRQPHVVGIHPLAVVFDPDLLLPAELDMNPDPSRASVDRVLDQFLDDRRRPLDHLASGDLIRQVGWKLGDFAHGYLSILRQDGGRRDRQIQRLRRKIASMPTTSASMSPPIHQNWLASLPGSRGKTTFMPK